LIVLATNRAEKYYSVITDWGLNW